MGLLPPAAACPCLQFETLAGFSAVVDRLGGSPFCCQQGSASMLLAMLVLVVIGVPAVLVLVVIVVPAVQ